jgi:hypothetical protein
LLLQAPGATASHDGVTYSVHGSSATNLKCWASWKDAGSQPSSHSFGDRAVGSTTGQFEFVSNGDAESVIDFGSVAFP